MIRAYLSLSLLLLAQVALPQQAPIFRLHQLGPQDGLSNRHITALVQDNIGFVWAGTVSGLDRFDGHDFRNWSVSDGLSGGRVDALRRDAEGMIWVFSTSTANDIVTIDVIDPLLGVLQPFVERFTQLPFDPAHLVRVGPQRQDGTMVLGASSPARCIKYERAGLFTIIAVQGLRFEPLGDDAMGNIIGHVLAADSSQRIVRLAPDGSEQVLQQLPKGTKVEPLTSGRNTPGALYWTRNPDGTTTCFDTYSELVIDANARGGSSTIADPVYRPINFTPLPRRHMHMVDTRVLDTDGQVLFDLKTTHPEVGNTVKDCMLDRNGDPWLATEFGLFHTELRGDAFDRLLWTRDIPEGFGVLCRGMAWHDGKLYLSTEWEGAMVLSNAGDSLRVQRRPEPKYLFATHVGSDGTWWRGGPQVVEREERNGATKRYVVPDKVWSILSNVNGRVLMGGVEGLCWLDPATGAVERVKDPAHAELDHAHVLQLSLRPDGDILATTSKGLYRLNSKGHVIERWWSRADAPMRLPYDDLHHCYADTDGILWLSTRGAGLVRFDPSTGKYQQYTMRNGFPNNMVYAAYEDRKGQLWLPTDGGIVRFDKQTRQSAVFTTLDGIAHDEFNRLAHAQGDDGRLYFGGLNGITAFDPADFEPNENATRPPLVLTGFMRYSAEQNGMVDRTSEIARGGSIELGEEDRSIQVSFALLSYEGAGRIVYAWRLAGVEDDWNYQQDAFLRLDRLPYGTHTLEVKARDAKGLWSEHVLQLPITVHMPWYASRMVWVGVGALIVLVVIAPIALVRTRSRHRRMVA